MDFNVVLRRELGKGIAVGILDQKQFPTLTAALDGSNKNLDLAIKPKSRFFSLTMNNEEDDTPKMSQNTFVTVLISQQTKIIIEDQVAQHVSEAWPIARGNICAEK